MIIPLKGEKTIPPCPQCKTFPHLEKAAEHYFIFCRNIGCKKVESTNWQKSKKLVLKVWLEKIEKYRRQE